MTGFIYEPLKPYTIQEWMVNLGNRFDADQWVRDFKEVGASHVVFYDKWIDGLVFHDTKTTNFKTKRDFVRELAAACQRGGLPLVFYFNALSDGNPEFNEWSLMDKQGNPIVFGARWPTRYQTLHSPFRAKCLEQVRELLGNYGPIHGIWHDIFRERLNTTSEWTARGYQKMFGKPFDKASPEKLNEFNARSLAGYLDEADAIRRERRQNQCVFTANGSGSSFLAGGVWTEQVGARLQYFFNEGHGFQRNEQLARMAWALPKPLDVNLLLVSSWFVPMENTPPPAKYSVEQAIAATAIAVCQGVGVNFALTPGHDGRFGSDVQCGKAVGKWFRKIQPRLEGAQPAADVAVVYGSSANAISDALARAGVFSRWIAPDQSLPACRAIVVPPGSRADERFNRFANDGGTLIIFGGAGPVKKLQGASVKVDSEYNEQFSADNLLDDDEHTAWASGGTPMPHWAEITLPEPVEVQTVELVSRQGPYLVTDVDIEISGATVKSIRDAKDRKIVAELDPPVKTDRVRVKIVRELFQGKDRQHADVATIRVLDRAGRNHARIEKIPTIVRNKVGKGQAVQVPCNTVPRSAEFWNDLVRVALGGPTYVVSADDAKRFRFILTRVGDARILHVIDAEVPASDYKPKSFEMSVAGEHFTVQPNPVATVVLKGVKR